MKIMDNFFYFLDYILFVIVLIVSAAIGFYHAIKARNTVTTLNDYLLGGGNMGLIPISCSLIATTLASSISVGLPAEAYAYGTYGWIYEYGAIVTGILTSWIFLPLFVELKVTSIFKYIELRFNHRVKMISSALYLFSSLISLSYTVYVPALTFQRVSGVDTYVTIIVLSLITAIYTAIGGFKAVIWTDVVQVIFMYSSIIIVTIVGLNAAGGIDNVLDAAYRGGRIVIANTDNINSRTSIWGHMTSTVLLCIYHYGLTQTNIQRYTSLSSIKKMRISIWILIIAILIYYPFSPILGIIIYATYETCDPHKAGIIKSIDQIVPHFIQEKSSVIRGFNGIFIAGLFAACLSTLSSLLNTMSGIIYEDFIKQKFPRIPQHRAGWIMKSTVLILCILQIAFVFFIESMGTLAQIIFQILALNTCFLLTLFFLGIFFPKANSRGAEIGAVTSIVCILTMIIGSSFNRIREPTLPFRTDGCQGNLTQLISPTISHQTKDHEDIFWLFRINFIYYGLIGVVVGLCVGYIASLLTGGNTLKDQRLVVHFMRKKHQAEEEVKLKSLPNQEFCT